MHDNDTDSSHINRSDKATESLLMTTLATEKGRNAKDEGKMTKLDISNAGLVVSV